MAKPEKTFENGSCSASVFINNVKVKGEQKDIPMVTINRRYLDKNKEWKRTNVFRVNDLPKLELVARKAYNYLTSNRKNKPSA